MRPFYASLDENQKRLLPVLMRQGLDSGGRMGMYHHGRDHHRMMERGRGMGGMMDRDRMERGRGMDRFH
jgi:hypothetical protein